MDPDPGGPKTCGSGGSRSATLPDTDICQDIFVYCEEGGDLEKTARECEIAGNRHFFQSREDPEGNQNASPVL
jgi:hypothetical protein